MKKNLITIGLVILQCIIQLGYCQITNPVRQKAPLTRILFIFDASNSMLGEWDSDKKINIARQFLIETVDSLENIDNLQMALRVYGHQSPYPPKDCNDTRLEVPFGPNNASRIRQELRYLRPKGTTPLAKSLGLSAEDFPPCGSCRNIIILITDGIEACDGDPCIISRELQKGGVILKPFVIGIGLDENLTETFNCIGEYFNAEKEDVFREAFKVIISQALNPTSAQVNLLDANGVPTETNVNMTFYDLLSGKVKYNYMHTLNHKGKPDTVHLDHLSQYRLTVNTIPPVYIDSIKITPGIHNVVGVDAPQGDLIVQTNGTAYKDMQFIVREAGSMKTLNIQKLYDKEKYIIGKYDIEVLTLPRIYLNDVEIKQSHTTKIDVPRPGVVSIKSQSDGYGSVYVTEKDGSQKWVCNLKPNTRNESIELLPGDYIVVYRAKEAPNTFYTISRKFSIYSGGSKSVEVF